MKIAQYGTTIVLMHTIVHGLHGKARFRAVLTTGDSTILSH